MTTVTDPVPVSDLPPTTVVLSSTSVIPATREAAREVTRNGLAVCPCDMGVLLMRGMEFRCSCESELTHAQAWVEVFDACEAGRFSR